IGLDELDPEYTAADAQGNTVVPGDRVFIHAKNTNGAASVTLSIDDPNSIGPQGATAFDPDVTIVIEPSGERFVGPILSSRFAGSDGLALLTADSASDLELAAFSLGVIT